MIRYITLFFGYCLSLKLTSSTVWFRDFTRKFTKKNKRKENNINRTTSDESCSSSDEEQKKQKLKKILKLLEEDAPSLNEVKLIGNSSRAKSIIQQFWPGASCVLILLFTTITITIKPFSSGSIYIWNYLTFLFLFIVWNNFKTCTQVPIYILIFIAKEKLCRLFPFRFTSRLVGKISDVTIPRKLRHYIYSAYIRTYGVNIQEAEVQDLEVYRSLNSFFRRSIQKRLRPVSRNADIVSPSDGTIVYHGTVQDGIVRQVKGMCFSLKELFADVTPPHTSSTATPDHLNELETDVEYANRLMKNPKENELNACVIYLAPGDYHRFHSPAKCQVDQRRHIAGELISVKPTLLAWLPHLFAINERVVLNGRYQHGFLSTVAVGATNVGSIVLYKDQKLRTNQWVLDFAEPSTSDNIKNFNNFTLTKGESLGEFRFGSTLVVIYEAPKTNRRMEKVGTWVKYGQALSVPSTSSIIMSSQ